VFVALALYVTEIGTPSDVGVVLACHAVPLVGFLLIGGVWADRLPRHLVVVTTDLIRFGLHGLLAALIFTGAVEVWHIAVIEACFGTAEAFYRPAFTGLVPQTVPEDEIQPARAAFGTVETIAEFAGPALATALVLGFGPGWAFALDAATFLVSAAFLVRLRPRLRGEPGVRTSVLAEVRDGWTEVRSRTWIWVIVAAFSLALLTAFGPWMTLGPTISIERYDTSAIYGILASAMGAGTIVGALIGFRWRPRHPMRSGMLLALPLPIALGSFGLGLPAAALIPIFVLTGTGIALFDIWWHTALAERVPPHMLSRVTAPRARCGTWALWEPQRPGDEHHDVAADTRAPVLHLSEQPARAPHLDALRDLEARGAEPHVRVGHQRPGRRAGSGILALELARERAGAGHVAVDRAQIEVERAVGEGGDRRLVLARPAHRLGARQRSDQRR
jgi:Major Facilitator Superfamily